MAVYYKLPQLQISHEFQRSSRGSCWSGADGILNSATSAAADRRREDVRLRARSRVHVLYVVFGVVLILFLERLRRRTTNHIRVFDPDSELKDVHVTRYSAE